MWSGTSICKTSGHLCNYAPSPHYRVEVAEQQWQNQRGAWDNETEWWDCGSTLFCVWCNSIVEWPVCTRQQLTTLFIMHHGLHDERWRRGQCGGYGHETVLTSPYWDELVVTWAEYCYHSKESLWAAVYTALRYLALIHFCRECEQMVDCACRLCVVCVVSLSLLYTVSLHLLHSCAQQWDYSLHYWCA